MAFQYSDARIKTHYFSNELFSSSTEVSFEPPDGRIQAHCSKKNEFENADKSINNSVQCFWSIRNPKLINHWHSAVSARFVPQVLKKKQKNRAITF